MSSRHLEQRRTEALPLSRLGLGGSNSDGAVDKLERLFAESMLDVRLVEDDEVVALLERRPKGIAG